MSGFIFHEVLKILCIVVIQNELMQSSSEFCGLHESILKDTLFSNKPLGQGQADPCRGAMAPGFGSEHVLGGISDLDAVSVPLQKLHSEDLSLENTSDVEE